MLIGGERVVSQSVSGTSATYSTHDLHQCVNVNYRYMSRLVNVVSQYIMSAHYVLVISVSQDGTLQRRQCGFHIQYIANVHN